jgi:hypothetical protein
LLDVLYQLPTAVTAAAFVAIAILLALALMFGLRAALPIVDSKETFDVTIRVMPTVLSLTAFVLGFSVVQANNEMTRAGQVVAMEAHDIAQLDRRMVRLDPVGSAHARRALADYARSIMAEEWPRMSTNSVGFGHPATAARLQAFRDALHVAAIQEGRLAAITNELFAAADAVEDARDARLLEAQQAVPAMFWAVILFLSVLMMSLGAFLKPNLTNITMVASQAAAIGVLSAFLFLLDHPFMGNVSISPWILERTLSQLSASLALAADLAGSASP